MRKSGKGEIRMRYTMEEWKYPFQRGLRLVEHSERPRATAQQGAATTATSCIQTQAIGGKKANQQGSLGGFSDGSHAGGETWEQEEQIAENIYDWWISGKSYKKWYVERFVQLWLKFD